MALSPWRRLLLQRASRPRVHDTLACVVGSLCCGLHHVGAHQRSGYAKLRTDDREAHSPVAYGVAPH
eukprot:8428800-Heterocapsa_arctica.AAC.1